MRLLMAKLLISRVNQPAYTLRHEMKPGGLSSKYAQCDVKFASEGYNGTGSIYYFSGKLFFLLTSMRRTFP